MRISEIQKVGRIAIQNDAFRRGLGSGTHLITSGVNDLGFAFVLSAVNSVREFNDFSKNNDPYCEHDFGDVTVNEHKLFWKIDYFQKGTKFAEGSEDPSDENTTERLLTIMLADEY